MGERGNVGCRRPNAATIRKYLYSLRCTKYARFAYYKCLYWLCARQRMRLLSHAWQRWAVAVRFSMTNDSATELKERANGEKKCTRYERNSNAIAKCISGDGSDCAEENRVAHTNRIRFCEFNLRANIHATYGLNSIFVQHSTLSSGILLRFKAIQKVTQF